jgi:hypothetical protein
VAEYPGLFLQEVVRVKSIEGVSTRPRGFLGSIQRGVDTTAKAAAVLSLGVLLGVVAAIAADHARRRRRIPPTP